MCDDVLWLRKGRVKGQGDPKRVVDQYLTFVAGGEEALLASNQGQGVAVSDEPAPDSAPGVAEGRHGYREGRWGTREVEISAVRLLDARGRERHVYVPGESLTLAISVNAPARVDDFVFGVGVFTTDGVNAYGTNTHLEDWVPREITGSAEVRLELEDLRLVEGTYLLDVAVHKRDGTPYDYHRGLHSFRMKSHIKDVGIYRPAHRWNFSGRIALDPPKPRPELELGDD
jgi:hypothetical protein